MSDVPTVLQVGSPVINRGQSEYAVPSALRVGSPITREPPPAQARPPLTRRTDSGSSNRISQLFPSTPSLVSPLGSPGNASEASRQSFPSPLVPGPGTSYYIPSAPAPPTPKPSTFTEETAYNPIASIFTPESTLPPLDKSNGRTRKVLDRLALLNRGSFRGGRYNRLDNEEAVTSKGKLKGVEECDEPVGYDLSSLGGLPTKTHEAQRIESGKTGASARAQELDEATHVAEFESLEAQLGAGMTSIFHKPFTHTPAGPVPGYFPGHRRILSADDAAEEQAKEAQVEAEKTGQVVAVSAEVPIDISDFAGFARDFESMRSLTAEAGLIRKGAETSYFFPEDPQMPNWRPATMSQWWLLMLVVIALSLAGIQEYLCQRSMSAVRQDPKNGGLTSFEGVAAMDPSIYFAWKYAPIMIFVFYGVLWQMSDFEVKRLEPFYQLSKKTGATAGESLNMDYLTFMSWLVPLRALRHKQYAVIYSSLGTLIASSLVPVLQSSSLYMHPSKLNRNVTGLKSIRVQPIWSRAVSACLVAVACCGGALMYAMRRKSGLQSDPKGIAGIAAMATKSHILADFKGLDCAPLEQIHKKLRNRRYILHKSSLWQGEYIKDSKEKIHEHGSDPRPLMLRYRSGIPFISFLIAFTIAVPVFTFVDDLSIFKENFPWIMTGLATVIRILWNTMNCDIRMLQPFYLLSLRHAPAKTLTLDYAGTNPFWLPIKAFLNRHYLVMFVAFGSVLAEICTVCVSSISVDGRKFIPGNGGKNTDDDHDGNANDATDRYNTDQTFRSFWTSFTLAMIILLYLIAIALIAYAKRSHKFMPRQIGTMASVLAYIHQSKMLVSFVDTEKFNSNKMTRHLEKTGKTYALGWFRGRDGEDHLGIDEEEIHSAYVYGKDWTEGRLRPGRDTEWEHY